MIPPIPDDRSPSDDATRPGVSDVSLLRLAQALVELSPTLAAQLSLAGLDSLGDSEERESWRARLAPILDEPPPSGGPILSA
jgi:hypothetical protein